MPLRASAAHATKPLVSSNIMSLTLSDLAPYCTPHLPCQALHEQWALRWGLKIRDPGAGRGHVSDFGCWNAWNWSSKCVTYVNLRGRCVHTDWLWCACILSNVTTGYCSKKFNVKNLFLRVIWFAIAIILRSVFSAIRRYVRPCKHAHFSSAA